MCSGCIHTDICRIKPDLVKAFGAILEQVFGGIHPAWEEFDGVIMHHCRFFKPKKG